MVDRRTISSGSSYEQTVGFSRAVRPDRRGAGHVHHGAHRCADPDGRVDPDPLVQARRCWQIALAALAEAGADATSVVRTRTYLTDRAYEQAASLAHGELFATVRPASTMLVVAGLLDPRWLLEVELDAYVDPED